MPEQKEKRNLTKSKIIYYMLNHSVTSKAELAKELNLSMPTVLTNVNELIAKGIIAENGEYESTGGRKAKSIGKLLLQSEHGGGICCTGDLRSCHKAAAGGCG